MSQFEKNQIITFDKTNAESIKHALKEYQNKLDNKQVLAEGSCSTFDVAFMDNSSGETKHLQISDTQHADLVVQALDLTPDGSYGLDEEISHDHDLYISEVIFFALALEHSNLLPDIRRTAQAMVDHARYFNDTSSMWVDDMRVFGAEALYVMARLHPEDAFYLSQFFIPYWDDEHATGYDRMFTSLVANFGWTEDMMKAFVWCDNKNFRYAFYGMHWEYHKPSGVPLGDFLKENPEYYPKFKQLIIERFKLQPMLAYHEGIDHSELNPVMSIYQTLFAEICRYYAEEEEEKVQEVLESHFIEDTLENEAFDLQQFIKSSQETPLSEIAGCYVAKQSRKREREAREDALYEDHGAINMMNEFINSLSFGSRLLDYIKSGEGAEVLDELLNVNIWEQSKVHAPTLYDVIDAASYSRGDNEALSEYIHEVVSHLCRDLLIEPEESNTENHAGIISRVTVWADKKINDPQTKINADILLRYVDCLYYLLGCRGLSEETTELLTDGEEYQAITTKEEFEARYLSKSSNDGPSDPWLNELDRILFKFTHMDEKLSGNVLDDVDRLFADRTKINPTGWGEEKELGTIALAAYLLHRDVLAQVRDEYSDALIQYIGGDIFHYSFKYLLKSAQILGKGIFEDVGFTSDEIDLIENYFTAEEARLNQEEIINLLNTHLLREEISARGDAEYPRISEKQISYHFLGDYDDDYQRAILCFYWLKDIPIPICQIANRLWNLMVAMAPVKIIHHLSKIHRFETARYNSLEFKSSLDEIEFYEALNKHHGIDRKYTYACELAIYHDCYDKRENYLNRVDLIEDLVNPGTGMFAKMHSKQAQDLLDGLDYIKESTKLEFYLYASLAFDEFKLDLEYDFQRTLKIFIRQNIIRWGEVMERRYQKATLFSGPGWEFPDDKHRPLRYCDNVYFIPKGYGWTLTIAQELDGEILVLASTEEEKVANSADLGTDIHLLDASVDANSLIEEVRVFKNDDTDRVDQLLNILLSYLQGNGDVNHVVKQFQENFYLDDRLSLDLSNYGYNYSVGQFLWCIDEPRRQKLMKFLANLCYRGYRIMIEDVDKGYAANKVRNKEWTLADMRESQYERLNEDSYPWLMDQLLALDVHPANLLLWTVKRHCHSLTPYIVNMVKEGKVKPVLKTLYVDNRCELVDILKNEMPADEIKALFKGETSRRVKNLLAKLGE